MRVNLQQNLFTHRSLSRCLYSESVAQTTQASPSGAGKTLFYEGKISEQVALPYTQTVYEIVNSFALVSNS